VTAAAAGSQAPWAFAQPWGGTSRLSDLDGQVHWVDFGGPAGRTPIVLVHGLGGSHLNWVSIAPALAEHTRVFALDLAGFGLTPGRGRSTTVTANAHLLDRFIREIAGGRVVLVGNSMGGMVSLLHTSAHPNTVAGIALIDPSIPVPRQLPDIQVASRFLLYAVPFFGEQYLAYGNRRMTDRQRVLRVVELCFADPSRASGTVLDAATALAAHRREVPDQEADFLEAARSLMRVLARPQRYEQVMRSIDCPVLLIHGERDRLVPVSAARKVAADNPHWQTVLLPDVGHTPQLEAPGDVIDIIVSWLQRNDLSLPVAKARR
jgi:pimeloyl-ACP methyl ester carboxylesterase